METEQKKAEEPLQSKQSEQQQNKNNNNDTKVFKSDLTPEQKQKKMKELFPQFVRNVTQGCGRLQCKNKYCASNPEFKKLSNEQAASKGISLYQSDEIFVMSICDEKREPKPASMQEIEKILEKAEEEKNFVAWNDFISSVFSSENTLKSMFYPQQQQQQNQLKDSKIEEEEGQQQEEKMQLEQEQQQDQSQQPEVTLENPQIDIEQLEKFYDLLINNQKDKDVREKNKEIFESALMAMFARLGAQYSKTKEEEDVFFNNLQDMRIIVIFLYYPDIIDKRFVEFYSCFTDLLKQKQIQVLTEWLGKLLKTQVLSNLVDNLHSQLMIWFIEADDNAVQPDYQYLNQICNIFKILYKSNQISRKIKNINFINEHIKNEPEVISVKDEYIAYLESQKNGSFKFSFVDFPFLMDVNMKQQFLQQENEVEQIIVQRRSLQSIFTSGNILQPLELHLNLKIKRNNILEDALQQISIPNRNWKLQLKVQFEGEQGIDEGGVQKEFFILLVKELFNLDYGMFLSKENGHFYWFNGNYDDMPIKFELVGLIIGLAIYNNVLLDIKFPTVIYKKMLKQEIGLEDIKEFDPEVYKGLKHIQEYEEDDLEDSAMTFQVSYNQYYMDYTHELKENGKDIVVNQKNKQEYIDLYVDWYLNKHIYRTYSAYERGFYKVVKDSKFIQNLEPDELQQIICGCEQLDFNALKKVTRYADGYTPNSQVIKWFWELVLGEFNLDQQKRFLLFMSGSDRSPVQGLSFVKMIIVRQAGDSDKLPSSSTCFNHFFLPEYESKEKLKQKLMVAMENAEGFGLL